MTTASAVDAAAPVAVAMTRVESGGTSKVHRQVEEQRAFRRDGLPQQAQAVILHELAAAPLPAFALRAGRLLRRDHLAIDVRFARVVDAVAALADADPVLDVLDD